MEDQKQSGRCQGCWRWIAKVTSKCLWWLKDNVPHPLAKAHGAAGALLLIQAIVTAIMTALFSNRFGQAIEFKRTHLFTLPASPLVPCFMGVAAFGHIWSALGHKIAARFSLFNRITQHKGWLRWAEKSVSVGLMYVMVAILCDKEAAIPLLWLVLLNACSMGTRLVMERDVERKMNGSGRYSKSHPVPISSKNVLGNLVGFIEQQVQAAKPPVDEEEEGDEADPNQELLEVVPDSSGAPSRSAISSDWEVITSSLIMDLIALGMFLPYYIDDVQVSQVLNPSQWLLNLTASQDEKWFVHASVGTIIATVFGYTGLLILYRRAALILKRKGTWMDEDRLDDDDDREAWTKQDPPLKRTKLHAQYEQLETWLIGWSFVTTSGLGWLMMIGVLQDR